MKKKAKRLQFQVRVDDDQLARIEKYQQQVARKSGVEVTFSQAVRSLIDKGLEAQ